jgi:hypothetical protein
MRRFLRFVLPWLIAFALPVQGVAAATMVLCGPMHQRMAGEQNTDAAAEHQAHGMSAEQHASHHAPSGNVQDVPSDKYSCSACSTCPTGATMAMSSALAPDSTPSSSKPVTSETAGFIGFVPDRPEHPPRSILV